MKKFVILIFMFVLFVFGQQSKAQDSEKIWSLQECIDHAWENNIQIKQQILNVRLNEDNFLRSKASLLPSLNAGATHVYNYGRTVDLYTNQFANERIRSNNFYISSNITVFNGFQLLNSVKQSRLNLMASKLDVDQVKDDMALNVATAYLQVLYSMELLDNAKGQLNVTRQQVEKTRKMVEAGSLAQGNLYTIQAQAANEEVQLVNAENQLDIAYLTLAQLMDLKEYENFEIEKPVLGLTESETVTLSTDMIFNQAVSSQPSIKSAEVRIESSEKGLSIAKGMRSPSLRFQGSWGTGYSGAAQELSGSPQVSGYDTIGVTTGGEAVIFPNFIYDYNVIPFSDQVDQNSNYTIGLYLTVPIFNGYQVSSTVNQAKIAVQQSNYNLELAKNNLRKTIQQAHADAVAAMKKYKASEKSVQAMQESFNYTEQKYNVGMVSSLDYNDAKNKLAQAKSDLLQSKFEYVFRVKVLDYYMGKPLTLK